MKISLYETFARLFSYYESSSVPHCKTPISDGVRMRRLPSINISIFPQQTRGPLDTDQEFTITAGAPGTYTYFCSIHPKMTGKIVVEKP